MLNNLKWVNFHRKVKTKYLSIAPKLWWGDDLDVRFYLLKILMKIKNKKILDIGCNIGITLSFLDQSNELHGIEIDSYCVKEAKKLNPYANFFQGSMEKLPYDDKSMDIVIMMNVLPYYDFYIDEHSKNQFISDTLNEVHRVLKDDGVLYFTTPNGESIHYKGAKATLENVVNTLKNFNADIKGWNDIKPIFPFLSKRYKYIPPKFLCRFEFIWERLVNRMNNNINSSKYFYVEAKKKIV